LTLAQTGFAIGSVSRFLAGLLTTALWNVPPYNPKITVQRPQSDIAPGTGTQPRINLFLYEVEIDSAMRNTSLTPGSPSPLWVTLRYLMTAFDGAGESDTTDSHDLLGMGMQVLAGVEVVLPATAGYTALADNPEPLKLTFDQGTPDLLSRLMQGPDDKFRCSAAFQVRPVMIAQPQLPAGMQLIGVNYQLGTKIGLAGVRNFVLPSMGPQLDGAQPAAVELGDTLTLVGNGLDAPGLAVNLGSAVFTPNMQHPQALSILIAGLDPTSISAGSVAASVSQTLANGLSITSGMVGVALLPTVTSMTISSISTVSAANPNVFATIALSGSLLGGVGDYVEFALIRNGTVALLLDVHDPAFTPPADQGQQQFAIPATSAVPQGLYFAVFRANGQQAKQAFTLNMVAP
jgi:Pvc16 N-terminal domain